MELKTIQILRPRFTLPPSSIAKCLNNLKETWKTDAHLATLWQEWNAITGPQLAKHCQPISLKNQVLTIGASEVQWLQALYYNRQQLIGAIRSKGFEIKTLRIQKYHLNDHLNSQTQQELEIWQCHPSRADIHGTSICAKCNTPAPAGEMARWGCCSFCQRNAFHSANYNFARSK